MKSDFRGHEYHEYYDSKNQKWMVWDSLSGGQYSLEEEEEKKPTSLDWRLIEHIWIELSLAGCVLTTDIYLLNGTKGILNIFEITVIISVLLRYAIIALFMLKREL
jgi:hypothetical protein